MLYKKILFNPMYCRGTDCLRSLGVWERPACSLVPVAACWYRLLSSSLVLHREAFTVRTSLLEAMEDFPGDESTRRGDELVARLKDG